MFPWGWMLPNDWGDWKYWLPAAIAMVVFARIFGRWGMAIVIVVATGVIFGIVLWQRFHRTQVEDDTDEGAPR